MSDVIIENIRSCIAKKGLKQNYIAEKAGFTPQEFSNILCGRKKFNTEYVVPVCRALGITANELFGVTTDN